MHAKSKLGKISVKMLLSYLSILLTPLVAIILIYLTATTSILRTQEEKMRTTLSQTVDVLDIRLSELYSIQQQLSQNVHVISILNNRWDEDPSSNDIFKFYKLCKSLPNYQLTNQIIENLYIFFDREPYAVKQTSAFALNQYTYRTNVAFADLSYKDFQEIVFGASHNGSLIALPDNGNGGCVLMLQSLPLVGAGQVEGCIVFELNLQRLEEMLGASFVGPRGMAFIRDTQGHIVTSLKGPDCVLSPDVVTDMDFDRQDSYYRTRINGEDYHVCTLYSEYFQWCYTTFVPREDLLAGIGSIRGFIVLLGSVSVGVGMLVCLILWKRRKQLIEQISLSAQEMGIPPEEAKSELSYLGGTINRIADTVDSMRSTLRTQETLLVSSVLRKLLYGDFVSGEEFAQELASAGLRFEAGQYFTVTAVLQHPADESAVETFAHRVFLKKFLADRVSMPYYAYDVDEKTLAVVVCDTGGHSREEIADMAGKLYGELMGQGKPPALVAVSRGVGEAESICGAFSETLEIAHYGKFLGIEGVQTADCMPKTGHAFFYPFEMELRLTQLIRHGKQEELDKFCAELCAENFQERSLSLTMTRHLTDALRLTAVRALKDVAEDETVEGILQRLADDETVQDVFDSIRRANAHLCKTVEEYKYKELLALKEKLRLIIEENYSDSTFNIAALAQKCQMSETVLYKNFRSYFNVTFTEYLENLRISKACELLKQKLPVKEIALMVGYSSDYSFRRAFKRIMNLSPSKFAEIGRI